MAPATRISSKLVLSIFLFSFSAFHCDANAQTQKAGGAKQDTSTEINDILVKQAAAWNQGDLEKFMDTYWKSDQLTFCGGGKTTHGWQATLDNYKRGYAPPKEMGHLHFDGLSVMMIEANSALAIGNWHLKMKDDSKKDGNFSLVVKRINGNWKIIHDHSSTLEPKPPAGNVSSDKK